MGKQSEVDFWINRANQLKQQSKSSKKAEKMVLGYENPTHGLRYIIIYRIVDRLDSVDYTKPFYTDAEGYMIGVRKQRIYNDIDKMLEMWEAMKQQGFEYEKKSANHYDLRKIFDYGK